MELEEAIDIRSFGSMQVIGAVLARFAGHPGSLVSLDCWFPILGLEVTIPIAIRRGNEAGNDTEVLRCQVPTHCESHISVDTGLG
jgi:hypothetical protein